MRAFSILAIVAGVGAMVALVLYFGAVGVWGALLAVGWLGFASIVLIHIALTCVMGLAWHALLPRIRWWVPVWGRFVRDAGSEVLPLSQVGGYVLGTRAVALFGVPATRGAASTIVDVTLEFVGQLGYTALGLLWLLHLNAGTIDPRAVVVGLALASCLALGFVMVQRRGIVHIDRIARILGRGWAARTAAGAALLHAALESIYRYRSGIWASFLLHFGCWVVSAAEMWVALRLANAPLPFGTMIVIESLVYATRAVAFVVPNSVGVQEGAYVVLGTAFGLSPEMGLALSLLKRARDLTIGMPVLVVWQAIEGGRLMRRAAAKAPGAPMGERE